LETVVKKLYEGLFLVDSGDAASDFHSSIEVSEPISQNDANLEPVLSKAPAINDTIRRVLERNGAKVVSMGKWDERKLAYKIQGRSRGTYILTYFEADPAKIGAIERDVQLSEQILRVLILRTDNIPSEHIEKQISAISPGKAAKVDESVKNGHKE